MKIFKFGGASVKSASAVKNVAEIIGQYNDNIVIVVSAMGKVTNLLEELVRNYFFNQKKKKQNIFNEFKNYHLAIIEELFGEGCVPERVAKLFSQLEEKTNSSPGENYDFEYDQIIYFGELFSTTIISEYFLSIKKNIHWVDVKECIKTDNLHRAANVNWELSKKSIKEVFSFSGTNLYITQGFIGSTEEGVPTSLGREGSDFTAAILGNALDAKDVTIWKDVPGVLNADPKLIQPTQKLNELSYREAIEMAHSGAKVIHPKTIKPLQNKDIPLWVKSFVDPEAEGTLIHPVGYKLELTPVYIIKQEQVLITLSPSDFSFVGIDDIQDVFTHFPGVRFRVNMFQQSAIDLNLVIDHPEFGLDDIIADLSKNYEVKYNTGLELVTIRYYTDEVVDKQIKGRKVYIEQKSRKTARLVLK